MYLSRRPLIVRRQPNCLAKTFNSLGVKVYEGVLSQSGYNNIRWVSATVQGDRKRPTNWGILSVVPGRAFDFRSWTSKGSTYHRYDEQRVSTLPLYPGSVFGRDGYQSTQTINIPAYAAEHASTQIAASIHELHASLGESLAECTKTAAFIIDKAKDIATVVRLIRKGKFAKAAKYLGLSSENPTDLPTNAASAWLQWQYGVIPIVSDINTAIDLFNNQLSKSASLAKIRGSWKESNTFQTTVSGTLYEYSEDLRYRFQGIYSIDEAELAAAQMLGLGNPAAVAWALTPWSFLVDMVLPVADWINSQSPLIGATYLGGHVSVSGAGFGVAKGLVTVNGVLRKDVPSLYTGYIRQVIGTPRPHLYLKNPFSSLASATSISALIISQSSRNNPAIRNG